MKLIGMATCVTIKCQKEVFRMTLGRFITDSRENKGWSRRELARRVSKLTGKNISATHIGRIEEDETRSPGLELLLAIGEVLNVHPMDLIAAYKGKPTDGSKSVTPELRSSHDYTVLKFLSVFAKALETLSDEEVEQIAAGKLDSGSIKRFTDRLSQKQNRQESELE